MIQSIQRLARLGIEYKKKKNSIENCCHIFISLRDRTRRYWITAIVKFYLYTSVPCYRTKLEDKTTNMIRLECSAV